MREKVQFRKDYLVLRAHADSPQQPPLLFAEDAVNLPHWWEVKLIWWPIEVEEVSLVIIHLAADHFNAKGRFKAALSGLLIYQHSRGFPSTCHSLFICISKTIK